MKSAKVQEMDILVAALDDRSKCVQNGNLSGAWKAHQRLLAAGFLFEVEVH